MKVMVIGGTGHVGKFMSPQLVEAGHEVVAVGSGRTKPPTEGAWGKVKCVACSIGQGDWADQLRAEKPEVVVEMPGHGKAVYEAFKGHAKHVVLCGSIWMFGLPRSVPTPEVTQNPCVFDGYKERYADMEAMMAAGEQGGTVVTAIMPPNICGPGKIPLDTLGGRDVEIHKANAAGVEVVLPDGPDALIGPCDAEDIARCFVCAVTNRDAAAGEFFNVGSAYALTAEELVRVFGEIHGVTIPVRRVQWSEYVETVSPGIGWWWHFKAHMRPDISKAQQLLGYEPQHTPEKTLERAVKWMKDEGLM